ncbi:hypothetical protein OG453_44720 [Streptomyces sp. NBC_01381]|uniref:hypothetical protein n=1 Tax=Streptomyces sp. NBC_01381 TaxID=2903845 RepID=UPI00225B5D5F|nr:hypothetical protein [Streptomyces sp. NBC_01381]MCX4673663.1 hypothetical protein [Streptomyces sp. NBC_01381]
MTPHRDGTLDDPISQAERVITASSHRLQRLRRFMTWLGALGPFPVLIAIVWLLALVVQHQLHRCSQILNELYLSPGGLVGAVLLILGGSVAALAYACLFLAGAAHLLRHRNVGSLARFWRYLRRQPES